MQNINWRLDDNKRVTQRPFWQLFQFLFFFPGDDFHPVETSCYWKHLVTSSTAKSPPALHLNWFCYFTLDCDET